MISAESLFSKTTTLFKENIQVTGRSCEISETVNTTIFPTGDFLSDIFSFQFQGEMELKETCLTVNGIVTNNWSFKDVAHIKLATTCFLTSEKINCGALKLTSSEDTVIEAEPARMSIIRKSNTRGKKAFISEEEFRGNNTMSEAAELDSWKEKCLD